MSVVEAPPRRDDPGPEDGPATSTGPARASAWVAVVALVAAVFAAPGGGGGFGAGDFGRVVAGVVQVQRGEAWDTVPLGGTVATDDTIRTQDAAAELEVRGGSLSLARWTETAIDGDRLELARGALLFESERDHQVDVGGLSARGRGDWRTDAAGISRVAVYRGGLAVTDASGTELALRALEEVPIVAGGADQGVRPLRYLAADPWDARLLADAIAVDRLLRGVTSALASRYGDELQEREFYGDFTRFDDLLAHLDLLAERVEGDRLGPPAPTLVALVVADLLVTKAGLTPDEAAAEIDDLRQRGATWGLIVVGRDLTAADLDATVDRSLRQRGEAVEEGTAAPVRGSRPGPATSPGPTPTTPPTDEDDDGDGDGGGGGPDPTPTPTPTPPPDDPGTLNPVEDRVDDLGTLLEPIVPGASDVTDQVNEQIDTVDDLLPDPPVPSSGLPVVPLPGTDAVPGLGGVGSGS